MNVRKLTELFRDLGARNPESWAESQIQESLPQLARFLFLREAWKLVVRSDDQQWIAECAEWDAGEPGGVIVGALQRLKAIGAPASDLTTVVRVMQWRLLSGLCELMDDPGDLEEEAGPIAWRLFQVNEHDKPIAPMGGLIESVLETEPSGNELRDN